MLTLSCDAKQEMPGTRFFKGWRHPGSSHTDGELMVSIGKKVANFSLPATGEKELSLKDFKGKHLVLYFYPKDNTPGCTLEGQNFRDLQQEFQAANAEILGVSRDSVKMHENFKAKQGFTFDLLSDADEALCKQFDVIHEKNMYGRKVMGVVRSTFLIDDKGVLRREWRKVKVKGHADEVLEAIKAL
jgi:peroxiredoxin Q/BCP